MPNHSDMKRLRELAFGTRLAQHLNDDSSSEYRAELMPEHDISDVVLKSLRSSKPNRFLQVVTIPMDSELREDTDRGRRIEHDLVEGLRARGVAPCGLTVHLGPQGRRLGIPRSLVARLADCVASEFPTGPAMR